MDARRRLFGASPAPGAPRLAGSDRRSRSSGDLPATRGLGSLETSDPGRAALERLEFLFDLLERERALEFLARRDPKLLRAALEQRAAALEARLDCLAPDPAPASPRGPGLVERRLERRQTIRRSGYVVLDNDTSTFDCVIVDLSDGGARLRIGDLPTLPRYFRLVSRNSHEIDSVAEIVWRSMHDVGVRLRR